MVCFSFLEAKPQETGGFEQLYYIKSGDGAAVVPMAHYTTRNNWYGEARYNYDEDQTFSLYAGKTFVGKGDFAYAATPLVGGLIGKMNGGSLGMNIDLDYQHLFFSTQSQYTFSLQEKMNKYFFSWTELGYQATSWMYGGLAFQQTNGYGAEGKLEPGCMLGFSVKNWTVPLYVFSRRSGDAYFVLSVNWLWENIKKSTNKPNVLAICSADPQIQ